jgi:hypothetical protein
LKALLTYLFEAFIVIAHINLRQFWSNRRSRNTNNR